MLDDNNYSSGLLEQAIGPKENLWKPPGARGTNENLAERGRALLQKATV